MTEENTTPATPEQTAHPPPTPEQIAARKEAVIMEVYRTMGFISPACVNQKVHIRYHLEWMDTDPEYKRKIEHAQRAGKLIQEEFVLINALLQVEDGDTAMTKELLRAIDGTPAGMVLKQKLPPAKPGKLPSPEGVTPEPLPSLDAMTTEQIRASLEAKKKKMGIE